MQLYVNCLFVFFSVLCNFQDDFSYGEKLLTEYILRERVRKIRFRLNSTPIYKMVRSLFQDTTGHSTPIHTNSHKLLIIISHMISSSSCGIYSTNLLQQAIPYVCVVGRPLNNSPRLFQPAFMT